MYLIPMTQAPMESSHSALSIFEGTRAGSEVEEADGDFMPIHEEDGSALNDGDDDHDEDGNKSIVAECVQHGRSANKAFDECVRLYWASNRSLVIVMYRNRNLANANQSLGKNGVVT